MHLQSGLILITQHVWPNLLTVTIHASSNNGDNADDHKEEDIVIFMSRWGFKSNDCKTRQTCFVSYWLRSKSLTIRGSDNSIKIQLLDPQTLGWSSFWPGSLTRNLLDVCRQMPLSTVYQQAWGKFKVLWLDWLAKANHSFG